MRAWLTSSLSGAGFAYENGYGVPLQLTDYIGLPFNRVITLMPK